MRRLAVVALLATAVVAAGAAGGTAAKPRLRIGNEQPLVVLGSSFKVRELVRVDALGAFGTRTLRVRTTSAGTFRVRFLTLSGDPCVLHRLVAIGALGSRAMLRLPPGACADFGPPPPG